MQYFLFLLCKLFKLSRAEGIGSLDLGCAVESKKKDLGLSHLQLRHLCRLLTA